MIWTIVIIAIATIVIALIAYSVARSAADGRHMEEARQGYLLRYQGGEHVCVVCGIETRYSLRGKPMHPGCRRDVA